MKDIWLSTTNEHKRKEFATLFAPFNISIHTPNELTDFAPVAETGKTFAENATLKAQALYAVVKAPVIADDSGLEVEALNGQPGIYSARYAGAGASDAANRQLLLQSMKDVTNRRAQFVCVIAFMQNAASVETFKGQTTGLILSAEQGEHGFGYDSLFFSEELGKTFAEATTAERNRVSHRARAMRKLYRKISE